MITVQPTIAWKINDKVSVGFGPTFNRIDGQLKNTLATNGLLGSNGDTKINIKGDDTAIGYNVGVMVDLTDDTTWGLTYHSKVKYHLGGNTEVKNAPGALGLNGKYDAKLDITLPESVDTSITHKFDDKWTGYLGAVWTRWSRLEKIEVRNSGVPALGQALGFNTIGEDLNWRDTWSFSVGTSYQATPEWVLRTGFAYEPSPTTNEDRNVRIPVGDRKVFTVGAGWSPNQDLTVDVAYAYLGNHCRRQPGRQRPAAGLQRQVRQQRAWPDRPGHLSLLIARAEEAGHCPAFHACSSGLAGDGFLDGGLELRIVRGGLAGELRDHPALAIHHVLVEIPARRLAALLGQLAEQRDRLVAAHVLRLGHGEGHAVVAIADLRGLGGIRGFLLEVVGGYPEHFQALPLVTLVERLEP